MVVVRDGNTSSSVSCEVHAVVLGLAGIGDGEVEGDGCGVAGIDGEETNS